MIKITTYGAAQEIGRSCILVEDKDTKVLLDCGLKIRPNKPTVAPQGIREQSEDLQGVILSHAHFDHSGYIPRIVKEGYKYPVHMTYPTRDICSILWQDHLKIEGTRHWTHQDMNEALHQTKCHYYNKKFKIADGVSAEFFDAGHILGSASILLDWKGQLIFYTGDINTFETPYHDTNKYPTVEDIAIVISEATNGLRDLPNRTVPNEDLIKEIYLTRKNGGITIIPSFALGRGQELEAILANEFIDSRYTIFVDGMIQKINKIYRKHFHKYWVSNKIIEWCSDQRIAVPWDLRNFIDISRNLADDLDSYRKMIVNEDRPNIVLSTSGMLEGGPIHSYLLHGGDNPDNLIALSGYQVEETLGRKILDGERKIPLFQWGNNRGTVVNIKAQVKQFRFSGHAQRNELVKMLKAISTDNYLFVHGDTDASHSMQEEFKKKHTAVVPTNGQAIQFDN